MENKNECFGTKLRKNMIIVATISVVITMIYLNVMLFWLNNSKISTENWSSIKIYMSGIALFGLAFVFLLIYCWAFSSNRITTIMLTMYAFSMVVVLHYLTFVYKNENGYNAGNYSPTPRIIWVLAVVLVFFGASVCLIKRVDIPVWAKILSYLLSVAVTVIPVLIFNPFVFGKVGDGYFNVEMVNINIVWETIYNIIDGVPYDINTTGQYGHYSLFFLLPLRFVSKEKYVIVISILFALIIGLQQVLLIYIFEVFSTKNWIAALLSIGSVLRITYFSLHQAPIRTFFPVLFLAFFTYLYKSQQSINTKKNLLIIFVFMILALICNLESAVSCIAAFVGYYVLESAFMDSCQFLSIKKMLNLLKQTCKASVLSIIAVFFAIGTIGLYNVYCGASPIFRTFFFPIFGGDRNIIKYVQYNFDWPVPLGNYIWEYIVIFLLGTISFVIYCVIKGENCRWKSVVPLIGSIALACIVLFTYYINEPLWTDLIIYKPMLYVLLAIFISNTYVLLEKTTQYNKFGYLLIKAATLLSLSLIAIGAVHLVNDPMKIYNMVKMGVYDYSVVEENIANIDEYIADNTYGMGQGVNIIYHALGRDNHTKVRDTSELLIPNSKTFDIVYKELLENETVLISESSYENDVIEELKERGVELVTIQSFELGDMVYRYCNIEK